MGSVLVVSYSEKNAASFTEMLNAASYEQIIVSRSCGEARRLLLDRDFDLVIVNAPLRDESGEDLSMYIASEGLSQVILIVKSECFDEISAITEDDGVLTVAKPINKSVFWSTIKLAKSAQRRIKLMRDENSKLKQRLKDIQIVDRAKCVLISHLNMSEQEAHRHIEKKAMDLRASKRTVAEDLLKVYDNGDSRTIHKP